MIRSVLCDKLPNTARTQLFLTELEAMPYLGDLIVRFDSVPPLKDILHITELQLPVHMFQSSRHKGYMPLTPGVAQCSNDMGGPVCDLHHM